MPTFASRATVKRTVFGYNEANKEEIDDVENANAPNDLPRGFGDFFPRVFSLSSSQPRKFGSAEGKRGRDKDGTESMEATEESTIWRMPNTSPSDQCVENFKKTYPYQYLAPMYPLLSVGTPPQSMIIPRIMNPTHAMTFIRLRTNSTYAVRSDLRSAMSVYLPLHSL
jgi:hypothetical protein